MNNFPTVRLWRRPNDLALDAALVAVAWYAALMCEQHLIPSWSAAAVLGMSVWLVYQGDRWLDVRGRSLADIPTQRHRLAARWRKSFAAVWIIVLLANVALALTKLPVVELEAGFAVLAASVVYTIGIQPRAPRRITKELQIGLIFAAGVGIFFAGRAVESVPWLVGSLTFFALVCFLNCALLAKWEMDADRQLGRASLARALGDRANLLGRLALALGVLGLAVGFSRPSVRWLGLYALGLWLMDLCAWPANPEDRRCAADGLLALMGVLALIG